MDGIVALGHFCETHGPVVIFCTQKIDIGNLDKQNSSFNSPVCDSCKSTESEEAIVSKDNDICYVSTRTPLKEDMMLLLKSATVRSISCEEMGKDGGVMYFGDDQRGHVITHTFYLSDSLARGFKRKYSLLIMLNDKIHLLNNWTHITKHFYKVANDLQQKASVVNNMEQANCSQKAARQAMPVCTRSHSGRSLQELTGIPSIYLQIHMSFVWLLSIKTYEEIEHKICDIPIKCPHSVKLRKLYKELPKDIFKTVCYCFLTGIKVHCVDEDVKQAFQQLLPFHFKLPQGGEMCRVFKEKNNWKMEWKGNLPLKLPTLVQKIEDGLDNLNLPDEAIESYLISFSFQWYNISCDINWASVPNDELLKSLGVSKCDLPLLSYWTTQVRNSLDT